MGEDFLKFDVWRNDRELTAMHITHLPTGYVITRQIPLGWMMDILYVVGAIVT